MMMIEHSVTRLFCFLLLTLLLTPATAQELPLPVSELQRSEPVDFGKEILPLLKRNCLACHHAKESEGGLNLETHESLMSESDSGSPVIAKDLDNSLLWTRATGIEEPLMPPEDNSVGAKPFTPEELGLIKLWIQQGAIGSEAEQAMPIQWQPIPESIRTIYAMDVSADGQYLASGRGNRVVIMDLASKAEVGHLVDPSLTQQAGGEVADVDLIQSIAFAPDGRRIATGGFRTVRLWAPSYASVPVANTPYGLAAGLIARSPDQTQIAIVNAVGDIEICSASDGKQLHRLSGHLDPISGLAWAGDRIWSCDRSGRLIMWQASTGQSLTTIDFGRPLRGLVAADDAVTIAAIDIENKVVAWRAQTAEDGKHLLAGFELEAATPLADVQTILLTSKPSPMLIAASESGGVQLINLADGKLLRKINHGAVVKALAINPDGSQIATGGADGSAKTWLTADGKAVATFTGTAQSSVRLARATADTNRQKAKVDRLTAHTATLEKTIEQENEAVTKITEERDKAKEALATEAKKLTDAAAKVTATEAAIAKAKTDTEAATKMIESSQQVLTSTKASSEKLTAEMQAKVASLDKAKQDAAVAQQQIDAANKALAAAQAESEKLSQEVEQTKAAIEKAKQESDAAQKTIETANQTIAAAKQVTDDSTKRLEGEKKAVTDAEQSKQKSEADLAKRQQAFDTAVLAQQRAVAAVPAHQQVITFETHRKSLLDRDLSDLQQQFASQTEAIVSLAFDADSARIATAHSDGQLRVYRTVDGKPVVEFTDVPLPGGYQQVQFDSNAMLCASGPNTRPILRSLQPSWELERTIGSPNESPISDRVTALDFRPDGLALAVGSGPPSRSGQVQIFSTTDGQLVRDFGEVHSDTVLCVQFSPGGQLLASSAADKTVRLLDIASASVSRSLEGHTHHVLSFAWQDDGQTIASASADQNIKVWNVETGEQRRTIAGFGKEITSIQFLGTTNQVISACADGQLRLHDTGNGKAIRTFNASGDFLFTLAVTPDGSQLVSGGQSGAIRMWSVGDAKLLHEWK